MQTKFYLGNLLAASMRELTSARNLRTLHRFQNLQFVDATLAREASEKGKSRRLEPEQGPWSEEITMEGKLLARPQAF